MTLSTAEIDVLVKALEDENRLLRESLRAVQERLLGQILLEEARWKGEIDKLRAEVTLARASRIIINGI